METIKKEKVAGSYLALNDYRGLSYYLTWETVHVADINKGDDCFELGYMVNRYDYKYCTGFKDINEAYNFVAKYITEHPELQKIIKEDHQKIIEARRESKEYWKAEKAKQYHLELKDLTPEHNLYYCDLVSKRLKNILRIAEVYTLKEISQMHRNDLKEYRNCGEKVIEEIDGLLKQVGLSWGNKTEKSIDLNNLAAYSNEAILAEMKRRGLTN